MADKVINKILEVFESLRHKQFFVSEAHFQHVFAVALSHAFGNEAEIILEFPIRTVLNKTMYIDIMVMTEFGMYPIELKYKTKRIDCDEIYKNSNIKICEILRNQDSHDLDSYDCWKDIHRIETLVNASIAKSGLCITVANDPYYWSTQSKPECRWYAFRMSPGKYKADIHDWNIQGERPKYLKDYPPLTINNDYEFIWQDFYELPNTNGLFKSLIIQIPPKSNKGEKI